MIVKLGKNNIKYLLVLFLALTLTTSALLAFAQTITQTAQDEKTQLQQQLAEIENQITQYQKQLAEIKGQKNTLQNKIKQLQKQQDKLNLQIKATGLQITDLGNKINLTQDQIEQNTAKITQLKEQLAHLIRSVYQHDNDSLLYILLSQNNLSDALAEAESYSQISQGLANLINQNAELNTQLNQYKDQLADQQDGTRNLLAIQNLQKQELVGTTAAQNSLLNQTKGVEANYQSVLNDTQKRAAQIRTRLYQLLGISTQITFGQAVQIAQWASNQTGVRTAFLLAILTQESNLGKNVGTCNRPGDPPEKSWRVVMKPDRDQQPFLEITQELWLDPDTTPVSCPMRDSKGNRVGWGGAMGPAQFIPSTWMGYKDAVSLISGKIANPWDIRDAFTAAAIKLKAAGGDSVAGEWAAAMRYFSGGTNPKYRFYGDNVVAIANQYQSDIDALK